MITAANIALQYGDRVLFKDVSLKFTPGNCYGVIGANGAGKSTFLKILSGDIEPDSGEVIIPKGERLAVLKQDQFAYEELSVLHAIILGHRRLYDVMREKDAVYEKSDFTEADGMRAAELEGEFAELGGWEAESEAGRLISGLGLSDELLERKMSELDGGQKVRVLLAQALFGNPDILLLDEPTNNLDLDSVGWLEEFLMNFKNTLIVVSHDRHFLNKVTTHIVDIDFAKMQLYVGNYDFWFHSSQLARKQLRDDKKRREDKIAELKEFIARFSSNAARSKQATSRQKLVEKLSVDDIKPSSRKAPYIAFNSARDVGKRVLEIEGLGKDVEDEPVLNNFTLTVNPADKIVFVGPFHQAKSALFEILAGESKPDTGSFDWGQTITPGYFPKDSTDYFSGDLSLIEWLRQYTEVEEESYVRGFLGRMLFTGDETLKKVSVLSGGERVRCMLSKLMLAEPNVLIMDEPTNHLDLEAITALNDALIDFKGVVLFTSHDHEFVHTIANRIIELTPGGVIDRSMRFDDYLRNEDVRALRDSMYHEHHLLEL
ncbi:MAG: ATP-binding cassette domain-containing protein [Spirochaetaceae bacterium]|nr:MAG: ATP-binding cassette domain-containing protein [Spirochaetaceae bacterium]